ncbi:hypothetical protein BEP19_07010 [Ammoniphilus oxalaticus]|uniref:Uncharacterized protein n=1 Tax=Ammoniphilus oxalaticus TaxID=66863 RepID=A0A419SJL4_9BACL|nr:hypothetical protein [Ammoniphilus oxalaticus]RKD24150.1 hypothetical protein BEP19_07010 [Ammoniphilus oxalaticus]
MGQAALFTPPPIHKTNLVIFPNYLLKNRLKQFCKLIDGEFTKNEAGLITIMNNSLEFHFKTYNKHLELEEMTYTPRSMLDSIRCLEFIKYESYLYQKPIYVTDLSPTLAAFLKEHGFRMLDEEEKQEVFEGFWEKEAQKV